MKNSVSDRIKLIIEHYGLNINSFSKEIGLSNNVTIGRIISEQRKPSFEIIQKILQTYGNIDANWLINGSGDFIPDKNASLNASPNASLTQKNTNYTPNTVNEAQRAYKAEKKEVFTEQNPRAGPYIDENSLLKAIIKERDTVIEDKNKLIKYLEDSITQHKEHLNALNERICDKEEMIAYLRSTINSMKQTIENNDIPKKKAS